MTARVGYLVSALVLVTSALVGLQFSSATWTHDSDTNAQVTAVADWASPTVVVDPLAAGIFGTVTVTATASDDRSDIGSMELQYAPAGGGTWTSLTAGCTASSGPSPLAYSCQWDTTTVTDGDYQVRALATDTAAPIAFTGTSTAVPTQVANNASVVLTTIPSPTRGDVTLTGTLLNAGNGSRSIRFEYAPAGTTSWLNAPGCSTGNTSDYTCTFDTTGLNGLYDVRAVGARGGADFYDVQADVLIDNTAPTASLVVPAGVLSGSVQLTVEASDAHSSVASVTIEYKRQGEAGWAVCGAPTSAPYSCTFDSTAGPDGTYDFRAAATDSVGNTSPLSTQTREVSNTAGTVEISLPAEGETVSGSVVAVAADAGSPRGVASVSIEYRAGSAGAFTEICSDVSSPYACTWNVSGLSNGAYELRAVMTEASGGGVLASDVVAVTVDNAAGAIDFTAPAPGSTVSGTVNLAATAQPASGKSVLSVTFQGPGGDAQPLCAADLSAPYTCSWLSTTVAYDASYQLRAVLTHTDGTRLSTTIVVKVDNVVGSTTSPLPTASTRVSGVVPVTTTVTSNAAATSVRIIATQTRPANPTPLSIPCLAGAGAPPAAVTYTCSWDTSSIANADYSLRSEATLANGTTVLSPLPASTVRVRNLHGRDVQGVPDGDGKVGNKDKLELTYTDTVLLSSVVTGWTNANTGQTVTLTFTDNGVQDSISFAGANLGTIQLGGDYVTGSASVSATMTASTVTLDGVTMTRLSIALKSPTGNPTLIANALPSVMTWTPSCVVTAVEGGSCSSTPVTESGTNDRDF